MKYLLTLLSIIFVLKSTAQQAWTQNKGEAIILMGLSHFSYDKVHSDGFGNRLIPRAVNETILSLYAEYGVFKELTFTLNIPFHFTSTDKETIVIPPPLPVKKGNLNALGNIYGGLTCGLLNKNNWVISSKAGLKINTSSYSNGTGLRTGYDSWSIEPSMLVGYSNNIFFTSAEAGISLSTNNYSDKAIFNAQVGKEFFKSKKLILIFALSSNTIMDKTNPKTSLEIDKNSIYTALYVNEQSFMAGTFKIGYKVFPKLSTWFSVSGGDANNIGQNVVYGFAFGYNFNNE